MRGIFNLSSGLQATDSFAMVCASFSMLSIRSVTAPELQDDIDQHSCGTHTADTQALVTTQHRLYCTVLYCTVLH